MLGIERVALLVFLGMLGSVNAICITNQYEHNGRCCTMCPKGTYVKRHCTAENPETECSPCEKGSYSTDWNSELSCIACTVMQICRPGMELSQNCSSTADYRCDCMLPSQYLDTDLDFCMDCKGCSPGDYPEWPCSKRTQCTACPPNTFSNTIGNYNSKCHKCTICKRYQSHCNRTHDAICDDPIVHTTIPTTVATSAVISEVVTLPSDPVNVGTKSERKDSRSQHSAFSDDKLIWVISAIAGVLMIIILLTILVLRRKKDLCRRRTRFTMIEESRYKRLTTGLLLRDVPPNLLLGVHKLVNPDTAKNWKDLAAELGFSYNEIANFAVERTRSAENMLASWQTRSCSTVDRLHEALTRIGREDVANFVAESVTVSVDSDV